jgi:ABC-type dipeptide/oligopeptide/nickel transport system permease component
MTQYVLKRLGLIFVTGFIIVFLVFVFIKLLPDYEEAQLGVDPVIRQQFIEREGLDRPILEQFYIWIRNIVVDGDFGFSFNRYSDVSVILRRRIPISVRLNIFPYLISIPIGFGLGIWAALKKNKVTDHIISTGVIFFISVPVFVVATLAQYYVVYVWQWFDSPFVLAQTDFAADPIRGIQSYILPVTVMVFGSVAGLTRVSRAELTEIITSEFMLLCRTKGLTRRQATVRHAFRNSMVPLVPSIIGGFVSILSGSLIIEGTFRVRGIGGIYLSAFQDRDYPLIMALIMFYTFVGLATTLVVDLTYGVVDPRIRMGGGKR